MADPSATVLLAFGGNLGDPRATIERAIARLEERGVGITARSRFYRTPPWGPVQQPDFVNACAAGETSLGPCALLQVTQSIERELGRVAGERWGPRAVDIDILDFDGMSLDQPGLALPHPRLTERAFVLVPLAEIAPDWLVAGRSIRDWAADAERTGICPLPAPTEETDGDAGSKPGETIAG